MATATMSLSPALRDPTCAAALRIAERDERPARLTHSMHEAFMLSFQCEPEFMGRRLAQDVYRWITEG